MSEEKKQFIIQRVYLKDTSFETPMGPKAFRLKWQPTIEQDVSKTQTKLDDNTYEVVLRITCTVRSGEKDNQEVAYIAEIQQGGIFHVNDFEGEELRKVLNVNCPNILFPYLRENLDNLITRGTFPALHLPPVNFVAVYEQMLAQEAAGQSAEATDDAKH
jgi:preprotein translocase subunit SecB